jgi:hypothetical protein
MLLEKNEMKSPENYTGFLQIMNRHSLKPAKPIDTFEGFKALSLPSDLESDKVT